MYVQFLRLHPEKLHFSAAWFFGKLMRGSRLTTGASAYGSTPRISQTSSRPPPSRASPSNLIDVEEINDAAGGDGDGAEAPATSTSARRCRSVASAPTRPSRPLDPLSAPNYSQSAYPGSSKGKEDPSSKGGKGGVSSREDFAGVVRNHHRLGNARASPGQLACPGIDRGRGGPTPHSPKSLQAVRAPAPGRRRILSRTVLGPRRA